MRSYFIRKGEKIMYLVTYYRHNKTTGGNAYKVDFATDYFGAKAPELSLPQLR